MRPLFPVLLALLLGVSCTRTPAGDPAFAVALGGHVNCALHGDNGGEKDTRLDEPFLSVAQNLRDDPRTGLKLVESHACRYKGHRVEHFVFQTARGLVSMFVDPSSSGTTAKRSQDKQFQMERFSVGQYAAYLVSELAPETSRLLAEQLQTQTSSALAAKPAN